MNIKFTKELMDICDKYHTRCKKCTITIYRKIYKKIYGERYYFCSEVLDIMKLEKIKEILQ